MSNTSHITKQLAESNTCHRPIQRTMMTYTAPDGIKHAKVLNLGQREGSDLLVRTARWATQQGVEIILRPM